jgi:hypothetical protein
MDSAAPPSRPKELASDVLRGLLIACRAEWWAKPANHVNDEHVEDAIQLVAMGSCLALDGICGCRMALGRLCRLSTCGIR